MDKIVYVYYVLLVVVLLWGVKISGKGEWNDGVLSLSQCKALQGFFAIVIMLHHTSQRTCADWLEPQYIVHGLDFFVQRGYFCVCIFLFCSGYGLYKSLKTKPDYLKGFIEKRIFPILVAFYSTAIIFLIVRFLMGEEINLPQFIFYITGLQLSNPNAWFALALPLFYLFFFLTFKYCKKDQTAVTVICALILVYMLTGTLFDHNGWIMQGEWWYNTAHFFCIGLLTARHENVLIAWAKKHYVIKTVIAFVLMIVLYEISEIVLDVVSYYGEYYDPDHAILRRCICLLSQIASTCAFITFVFLASMKLKVGNKVLAFMGTITLEFYLIHGLFIELFAYSFIDMCPSLYYIKNVAAFTLVVFVLAVPSALLLKKLDHGIVSLFQRKDYKELNKTC